MVAGQILWSCQFTILEAGVTNNLLSYHKEGDHYNYTWEKSIHILYTLDSASNYCAIRKLKP
jgi:hypothetical protein